MSGFYKGKKVLVTGHTGFKGSWLSQWLLDLGAKVIGISDKVPTDPSHFEAIELSKRIDHHFEDIRNLEATQKIFLEAKPDLVFHLAAQPIVRLSYDEPVETFATNVMGTVHVLEAVRASGAAATVVISSDKCYENFERDEGYKEEDHLGGRDPYSASKGCTEIVTSSYARSFFTQKSGGQRLASARAGNVIGGGDWAKDRLIPDCMKSLVTRRISNDSKSALDSTLATCHGAVEWLFDVNGKAGKPL